MQIKDYLRAASLEEAYACLQAKKGNRIIGGTTFLNMGDLKIHTAIDLQDLGLDYIREDADAIAIGAYTSLRTIETSTLLSEAYGPVFKEVLEHLIGVQLRNVITIGAHVASRFGFSDIVPTLLAMDASVCFYQAGRMTLSEFMQMEHPPRDILTEIRIPNDGRKTKVQMMRTSFNDYSLFCLAMCRKDDQWRIAAGVLPGRAKLASSVMEEMCKAPVKRADAKLWADKITQAYRFGNNTRASAQYRRELCHVFARRGIEVLADED